MFKHVREVLDSLPAGAPRGGCPLPSHLWREDHTEQGCFVPYCGQHLRERGQDDQDTSDCQAHYD